jgi:hypothetical protein
MSGEFSITGFTNKIGTAFDDILNKRRLASQSANEGKTTWSPQQQFNLSFGLAGKVDGTTNTSASSRI